MKFLQNYDFIICYRLGSTNIADLMTRKPEYNLVSTAAPELSKPRLVQGYFYDSYFDLIYRTLTQLNEQVDPSIKSQVGHYQVLDSLLYLRQQDDHSLQLCIPADQDLHAGLLHDHHNAPISGNLGIDKTYSTLSRHYFWSKMINTVKFYISSCDVCQQNKSSSQRPAGLL